MIQRNHTCKTMIKDISLTNHFFCSSLIFSFSSSHSTFPYYISSFYFSPFSSATDSDSPDNQWLEFVSARGILLHARVVASEVQLPRVVPYGGGREDSGRDVGVDGDVGAVDERLLRTVSHRTAAGGLIQPPRVTLRTRSIVRKSWKVSFR